MDLVDAGSVINNFRENLDEYKKWDAAGKEKIAETARNILKIEADYAEKMSKLSPRDGKKLRRKVDQDEAILVRFLADLGVGRHSPENQKCIDKLEEEIAVLKGQIEKDALTPILRPRGCKFKVEAVSLRYMP